MNISNLNIRAIRDGGKKTAIKKHDLLMLNRQLESFSDGDWTDTSITKRTEDIVSKIIDIWRVPAGHKSSTVRDMPPMLHPVYLSDLLSAGLLTVGQTIIPKAASLQSHVGTILSDGRIDVDGHIFETPSGAGLYLRKRSTNGWSFWLVDRKAKKSLASVRREYLEKASLETNGVEDEDEEAGILDEMSCPPV